MNSLNSVHRSPHPLHFSLASTPLPFPKPISSLSFRTLPPSRNLSTVRASSSGHPPRRSPRPYPIESVAPFLKLTCVTLTAAAALLVSRLHTKPAIASPIAEPATVEPAPKEEEEETTTTTTSEVKDDVPIGEQERILEEIVEQNPSDVNSLRALAELKLKARNLPEAIKVLNRLIALEPDEDEWPVLKAQIFSYAGDNETSRKIYEEVVQRNPFCVEAYHGLVMWYSENGQSMGDLLRKIEDAMKKCKKDDERDFKFLIAQVRVMEEKYVEALNVYDQLVEEDSTDFRPYLCQGIIYTIMKKGDVAEKKFEQFKKLVPKNHPYREFFMNKMFGNEFFSEKMDRARR